MARVNITEAKRQLSQLVSRAANGEEIVICRRGKPVAKMVRALGVPAKPKPVQRIGFMKGQAKVPDDFDEMMADEIREMFYGE